MADASPSAPPPWPLAGQRAGWYVGRSVSLDLCRVCVPVVWALLLGATRGVRPGHTGALPVTGSVRGAGQSVCPQTPAVRPHVRLPCA